MVNFGNVVFRLLIIYYVCAHVMTLLCRVVGRRSDEAICLFLHPADFLRKP